MSQSFRRLLPVLLVSGFACGMGLITAIARIALHVSQPSTGDPGAYIAVGLLGVAVLTVFGAQERHICGLEQQLRDRDRDRDRDS